MKIVTLSILAPASRCYWPNGQVEEQEGVRTGVITKCSLMNYNGTSWKCEGDCGLSRRPNSQ